MTNERHLASPPLQSASGLCSVEGHQLWLNSYNIFFDKVLILLEWDGLLLSDGVWEPLRPGQSAAQVSEKSS